MRQFNFFITALLFFSTPVFAGPFLVEPGSVKITSEFSWSQSDRIYDEDGELRHFTAATGFSENATFSKKEGSIYAEIGALSFLTFIANIGGGRQKPFEGGGHGRLDWTSAEAGMRIKLYQGKAILSVEGSYGYRTEKIIIQNSKPYKDDGDFYNIALLVGWPWRCSAYMDGFYSSSVRYKRHWQSAEPDVLESNLAIGINFPKELLTWRVLLLGEFFFNADTNKRENARIVEYKLQPSIVIFPSDHIGLQTGTRWQFLGRNTTRSMTHFVKIWLEF